jgi:lincosamide nucleotidyltransferase A/C/D/E
VARRRLTAETMESAEVLRVLDALDAAGIQSGITGGWGIDALLRRETRAHGDVDLGVGSDAIHAAIVALRPLGYVLAVDERPARVVLASGDGQVDLHPIVWDAAGVGVQTGLDGETLDYPAGSLDAEGEIGGRPVRCGTPDLQLTFHQHYAPREHDRRDMAALASAFGLVLPRSYSDRRGASDAVD